MKKSFDRYFYKTFFSLFAVVALQSLIVFSVNLADSIMLGSYSETAMSGVSLANQIQFLLQCLGCDMKGAKQTEGTTYEGRLLLEVGIAEEFVLHGGSAGTIPLSRERAGGRLSRW